MSDRARRPALFGWWGVTLAWLAWGAINVLRYGVMPEVSWADAVRYGLPDAVLWAGLTPLIVALSRRFEIRGRHRWRNLLLHAAAAVAVALGHIAVDTMVGNLLSYLQGSAVSWQLIFEKLLRYELHTRLLIFTVVSGFAHHRIYARRLAEQRAEASQLAAQLTEAKLTSLRRQLRPHFLFNALQSVAESIEHSPARGRRVIRRLGELLRASLRGDDSHWITLAAELELVRAYLEIEQVRFEDRLASRIEAAPEALACEVPSLVLQPIVENAVSHGIAPTKNGGTIAVRASLDGPRLLLEVADDGAGWRRAVSAPGAATSGIGLANTRDRLETLYGGAARLAIARDDVAGVRVCLELPARRSAAA